MVRLNWLLSPLTLIVLLALLATACAPAPPPTPTPAPKPAAPPPAAQPTAAPPAQPTAAPAVQPTPPPKPPAAAPTAAVAKPAATAAPAKVDKLRIRMTWTWRPDHLPALMARERGFFAKRGIEAELLEGSPAVVQMLGNRSEVLVFTTASSVSFATAQEMRIKAIATINGKTPMAVISYPDTPLKTPKDIEGRSIVLAQGENFAQIWPAFAKVNKIDESKVKKVALDFQARMTSFRLKQLDLLPVFVNNELPLLEDSEKVTFNVLRVTDWGLSLVSDVVAAHNDWLKENPDLARRALAALEEGTNWTWNNVDEAIAWAVKTYPERFPNPAVQKRRLELTRELQFSKNNPQKLWGLSVKEEWEETINVLAEYGGLKVKKALSEYYTNEFLPKS